MRSSVADPVGVQEVFAYDSPIGQLAIRVRDGALTGVDFDFQEAETPELPATHAIRRWLDAYFAGQRSPCDIEIALDATPFQRAVLDAACSIPFGEVRTYGWIASRIGRPRAARAVGQALGANPLPVVIPCHRVVAAGGEGGYGGGLDRKSYLLALERGAAGA
jgi:methylated-DNA-[protein]-cysteine S-methyltransferase